MSEQTYRSIGAIVGLAIGIGLMFGGGFRGVLPGTIFGAGGCVLGAIVAERIYAWNKSGIRNEAVEISMSSTLIDPAEPRDPDEAPPGRAVHRLAVLAVCLVWPLIWVGSLVTTYDAGMAVPDWPATYGYNLFLYPYKTWLLGPFDLFIEHGHRLLGGVVGVVAIAILIAAYVKDPRRWVLYLSIGVLVTVIGQGVLGGMRVILGDRTLAMVHGCVAPLCFSLCVVTAVVTSRTWWRAASPAEAEKREIGWLLVGVTAALVVVSYIQLVLGAQLRHLQPNALPGGFAMTVALHVMTAFFLWFLSVGVWLGIRRCGDLTLSRPAVILIGLLSLQIALGVGTWVVSYGWPSFLEWMPGSVGFLLHSKGFLDSILVTAHVATGALILAVSALLFVRLLRVRYRRSILSHQETGVGDDDYDRVPVATPSPTTA